MAASPYGPTLKAFEALDENGRAALAADLNHLARRWDRTNGGSVATRADWTKWLASARIRRC